MGDFKDFFFHQKLFPEVGVGLSSMMLPKLLFGGRIVDLRPNENFSLICVETEDVGRGPTSVGSDTLCSLPLRRDGVWGIGSTSLF